MGTGPGIIPMPGIGASGLIMGCGMAMNGLAIGMAGGNACAPRQAGAM